MKKGIILTITALFMTLLIHSAIAVINVDLTDDININNYSRANDLNATVYFEKTFSGRDIKIQSIKAVQKVFAGNPFEIKMNANPDRSLKGDIHYYDTPDNDWELMSIGYKGSIAVVDIRFYAAGDSICTNYNIIIEYEEENNIHNISDYDNIYEIDSDYEINQNSKNEAIYQQSFLDYIIITSDAFSAQFDEYLVFSRLLGMRTELFTTEYIYSNFSGADRQEQIRNFIREMYETKGIRYVLLGGDTEIIPVRYAYNDNYFFYGYVPTDMYYADMNDDWNYDRDCIIGETSQDCIDAYPDIVVSRLPFSNYAELNNLLNKYFSYIFSNNTLNLNKILLAGASLAEELVDGTGQRFSDRLITYPNTHSCNSYKLYSPAIDTFNVIPCWNSDGQLNKESFIEKINEGFHYINHIDHSNEFWMGTGLLEKHSELYVSDSIMLNTDAETYTIMFSMGCSPNGFDRESISEMLMNSSRSPITSYVGFTRTGWTSSQYLMEDYWQTLLNNSTKFSGDAYFAAIGNESRMYFRLAINMLGFPNMPVYKREAGVLSVIFPDSITANEFTINVSQGQYPKPNVTVVILDGITPVKAVTDYKGNAVFSHSFSDSIVIACVSAVSCIPVIDTLKVSYHSPIYISSMHKDISDPLTYSFTAKCTEGNFNNVSIQFSAADSLINISTTYSFQHLAAGDSVIGTVIANSYNTPIKDMFSNVSVRIDDMNGEAYNDSIPVMIRADSFKVIDFNICGDRYNADFIDTVKIVCCSGVASNAVIKVKATSLNAQVRMNSASVDYAEGDTILLTQIALSNVNGITDLKQSEFIVEVFANQREHDIYVTAEPETISVQLQTTLSPDGIRITHNSKFDRGDIFRSENNGRFINIGSFTENNAVYTDSTYSSENVRYYATFYDNLERICDTTEIITMDAFIKCTSSNVHLGASFYGKINGTKLYAKSSLNSADLNNDGKEEFVVQSDDGRVFVLDNDLNNITPFDLVTSRYVEVSPCIGDIDNSGCYDLILANGINSDTTMFIVKNPCSEQQIIVITGLGTMMSSPVIADVNPNVGQEILIGTTKGFYVLNAEGQVMEQYTKTYPNVVGISVASEREIIAFLDYYGKLFLIDFQGDVMQGFPFLCNEVTKAPILMTDLENDNDLEIIFGTSSGKLHAICENGVEKQGFPFIGTAAIYQSPVIADFGNDNYYEIVFCDINGKITALDRLGNVKGQYNSPDANNTFNEPIIADVDRDGKQEIIFVGSSGNISILNEVCAAEHNILALNTSVTCTPIATETGNNTPVIIVKDLFGNLIKIGFYSSEQNPSGLDFPKTLYDKSNTAYVRNFSTMKDESYIFGSDVVRTNYFSIKENITGNTVHMSYMFSRDFEPEYRIYNKAGMLVMNGVLDPSSEAKAISMKDKGLSSGEYFMIVSADKIYKEKILLLK